jgi:DNA-binding CsgD family transcriptional regulator
MVALVIRTFVKRMLGETAHAVLIAIAVFVNVGVWFIEQICPIGFEFLSISYIITELFLLSVHLFENENRRLRELLKQKDEAIVASRAAEKPAPSGEISQEKIECFNAGIATLTPTERAIFEAYLRGVPTKEIMSTLNIKENTLKFHNKNLYGKLGVSSRKELIEISKRADK